MRTQAGQDAARAQAAAEQQLAVMRAELKVCCCMRAAASDLVRLSIQVLQSLRAEGDCATRA